jgi:transcription elongation factor GreA
MEKDMRQKLTPERFEELKKELHDLKSVKEREIAEQIKVARSFGDLSENCEYDEAKNEQGKLYSRMSELEAILSNYEIIDTKALDCTIVATGCRVKVKDVKDGEEDEYWLVGSQEANPSHMRISEASPFGKSLLGHKVGDIVKFDAPAGVIEYKVMEIGK